MELNAQQQKIIEGLETKRYSSDFVGELENHVKDQCSAKFYTFEANHALLKLYQLYPPQANVDIIALILAKSLMNLPNNHFLLGLYIISDKLQKEGILSILCKLHNALESANYKEFWTLRKEAEASRLVESVAGFDETIREFIITVLEKTYKTAPLQLILDQLNLQEAEMTQFAASKGWKVENDNVHFPREEIKEQKASVVPTFDNISNLLKVR